MRKKTIYGFIHSFYLVYFIIHSQKMSDKKKSLNQDEATLHLFKKIKYDVAIQIASKAIQYLKQNSKDKIVFSVGKEQQAYPAALVKLFANVKSSSVRLPEKYNLLELMNLFEILTNLSDYQCSGLTKDYSDWQPVSSLVNMTELAKALGMVEVETFLQRLPALLTFQNKNAYENEVQRREKNITPTVTFGGEEKRSRSRTRSLGKAISRSLSRGRRERR